MDISLLSLLVMLFVAIAIAFWKGGWQLIISGFAQAIQTFRAMWSRVLLGMMFGGLIKVLIPSALIAEWLGPASGLKGILIGAYAGGIITGGPFVFIAIIASIYTAGAGVGPIIAFLTGHGLVGIQGLIIWQIPFLGTKMALTRYIVCFFIPPFVGLAGAVVYQLLI